MAWLWGLGKAFTVLFWWVVLLNLLMPMTHPFHLLINLTGALLMLLHLLEVLLFQASLRGRTHPWFDRLQILLVGIFHVRSIPTRSVQESKNA